MHLLLKLCAEELQSAITNPSASLERNVYVLAICQMQSCEVFSELFASQENLQFLINIMNLVDVKQATEKPYF